MLVEVGFECECFVTPGTPVLFHRRVRLHVRTQVGSEHHNQSLSSAEHNQLVANKN